MDLSSFLASLFICGRPSFPAKFTIESVPASVAEGGSVLLLVHSLPEHLQLFFSYKGVILFNKVEIARPRTAKNLSDPGPAHSGRQCTAMDPCCSRMSPGKTQDSTPYEL